MFALIILARSSGATAVNKITVTLKLAGSSYMYGYGYSYRREGLILDTVRTYDVADMT